MYRLYEINEAAPFTVRDSDTGKALFSKELYCYVKYWCSIELETQRNTELENGFINEPGEFVPHDEDWA